VAKKKEEQAPPSTEDVLQAIMNRLDRIEARLDAADRGRAEELAEIFPAGSQARTQGRKPFISETYRRVGR
jgi:hypothetical protein